ncbi:MAG: PAS domain S-box protein [Kofleriaceae bacterium]|nr:MAG: PAS domain S-box protein [Kofleriaceae bacterium]MBZ0238832.1 PAS domain S-box protein [Kofleriaceae bacterium]
MPLDRPDARRRAALTALELVARERTRVTVPAVFVCMVVYVAAFPSLGLELPPAVLLFDLLILAGLGGLAAAVFVRRVPLRWMHAASAAALWCPLAATLAALWSTHHEGFVTLFLMEVVAAGILLDTRWLAGTLAVANALAVAAIIAVGGPLMGLFLSCIVTATVFAFLIHVLMRRALYRAESMRLELDALVETSPDAMFVHCDAGTSCEIRWVNAAMLRLLGYDHAAELVGCRSVETFVHPDDRARLIEHRALVHAGGRLPGIDLRWVRRDGGTIHVHADSRPLTFAGQDAWLVVARDMTEQVNRDRERIAAETAIRKSEERYRLLFDGSPLPICVFDAETFRFVAVNDKMVEVYGYTRDELLAMTVKDIKPAEEVPRLIDAVAQAQLGSYDHVGVVRHRRKDGVMLDVDITAHLVEIDGRRYRLAIGVDVTEARRIEEQLRRAARMEAIGQLAGGVAHDFNNLLAAILSNANLIAEELGEDHPLRPEIVDIEAATNRATALTRQLLAFSRKQPRKVTAVALDTVVTTLEKMLSRLVGEDIEMRARLAPQLGTVQGDPGQLEQVLLNLVVNARDAMPTGGRLVIETANADLDESRAAEIGARPGRHVVLSVTDTGCGMTAETQSRIFEPFFTTKPVGKGTGLGLATVFGIVKQAEGGIAVESEVGRGTTFRVYFPRVDAVAASVPEPVREAPVRGTETILVVEDDPFVRAAVGRQLRAFGYRLLEACDPANALEVAAAFPEPIDLLLTDLVMPGMDGRALASQLLASRSTTRVLFMSGYSEHAAVTSAGLDSRDRLLEKPFTAVALSHAIRATLAARASA